VADFGSAPVDGIPVYPYILSDKRSVVGVRNEMKMKMGSFMLVKTVVKR
jgi:hypothetical protein